MSKLVRFKSWDGMKLKLVFHGPAVSMLPLIPIGSPTSSRPAASEMKPEADPPKVRLVDASSPKSDDQLKPEAVGPAFSTTPENPVLRMIAASDCAVMEARATVATAKFVVSVFFMFW